MVIRNIKRVEIFPNGDNYMNVEVKTEDGDWFLVRASKDKQPTAYKSMRRIYEKQKERNANEGKNPANG